MIHVHTFRDLSEANLTATWGLRFGKGQRDKVFKSSNPYRMLEISDLFGPSAKVPNPPADDRDHKHLTIARAYWFGSNDTPDFIKEAKGLRTDDGAGHLFVRGEEWFKNQDHTQYKLFLTRADPNFRFRAKAQAEVKGYVSQNFFTLTSQGIRDMELIIPPKELAKMVKGVAYTIHPVNARKDYQWKVQKGVSVTRK
jgi:hypothetical protein